jgi:hypothetical protein
MTRDNHLRRAVAALIAAALPILGVAAASAPAAAVASSRAEPATPGFNDVVYALARHGSTVYVGGSFTEVTDANGTHTRHGAAAFDRDTGLVLPWNPDVSGQVHSLAVKRGTVFLGGQFSSVGGASRRNLAAVDGSGTGTALSLHRRVNGPVYALAVTSKALYLGGHFSRVSRKSRLDLAAIGRQAPYHLKGWRPTATDGDVRALRNVHGGIVVGGFFDQLDGSGPHKKLGMVSKRTGALVTAFDPPITSPVFALASDRSSVYAAVGGAGGGFVASYVRKSGHQRWLHRYDGDVTAIARSGSTLYTGGHFESVCKTNRTAQSTGDCLDGGQQRRKLAALDLSGSLLSWNPGADSAEGVWALITQRKTNWLAAGGDFTHVSGDPHARLAVFD